MAVIGPSESEYEHSPSRMGYDGTHAPYGYAGFIVGECTVVCVECHDLESDSTDSPIFGNDESDYPGLWCHDCERPLDTYLLVYRSGPGSELWDELDDTYKI
jgi:hypothetical protein